MSFTRVVANIALVAMSLALGLALTEAALRLVAPSSRGYFVLVPGTDWTITAAPGARGVRGVRHYRVNALGIRGRSFGDDRSEYRILAIGGSSTECALLDDSEVWTARLEQGMRPGASDKPVWVGNVGRSGATTREHVLHIKYLLSQYPRIDVVVAMVGVNDMLGALRQGWRYDAPTPITKMRGERGDLQRAFVLAPDALGGAGNDASWYRATAWWRLVRRAKLHVTARRAVTLTGEEARARARRRRDAASLIDSLPPLASPLVEYRRNLNAMADGAAAHGTRLVLVTQPTVWREQMSPAEHRDLWFGWLGADWSVADRYYTTGALARAMAVYNDVLLEVCRTRGLTCVDAASVIPRDAAMFSDDMHFTDAGSRQVSRVLSGYFASGAAGVRPDR